MRAVVSHAGIVLLAACAAAPTPTNVHAEPWPAGDALFRRDPRWLGGDAVYSVDLGDARILWLFGDSFVSPAGSGDRRRSTMVRNTIALQHGRDPEHATLTFHWGDKGGGQPAAYFGDDGVHGFWPLHGLRVANGTLLLFQTIVRSTPGEGLGFAIDGWRLLRSDDVAGEPAHWRWREVACGPLAAGVAVGTAVWRDGEHVVALGTRLDGVHGNVHRGVLCRFALADLDDDRVALQWWDGTAWSATAPPVPAVVLDDAGPECSLHRDGERWLHVWSRGFGATVVAAHHAGAATGPWSRAHDVFTPCESAGAQPFVYAAKAHPELDAGDGWLAVSYATNSFTFGDLFTEPGQASLYWPRFWRWRRR